MEDDVIYLGFKIIRNGFTPVKQKIENLRTTKEPCNVSKLKSLL